MNSNDNEANSKNANLGTDGQNKQYSKVHGNRGKQLNPNQLVPLRFVISKGSQVSCTERDDIIVNFVEHYLTDEFLKEKGLKVVDMSKSENQWLYQEVSDYKRERWLFLEYIEPVVKNHKNASDKLIKDFSGDISFVYENVLILGKDSYQVTGYPYDEPLDYCPAIDGY
ncbi:hypothetical protein CGI74_23595 [Vibrio parahaemolyticus]|uniref:hypothetical protein n=1 Tax=Vibrio parahaemolyticus TaxID=670 RepID=UPI00111D68DC|nr:hypothetical protein [Vibrio parahaemolyticus]TOH74832.1 hypothetical protein CGI74_23595 [Vibrio parahaemolyticus]